METNFKLMAYKVFMADSSTSAIKAVHLAFQESGVDLYTAQDGAEVMDIVRKISPDAIVLALSLPNKDGYEIAFELTREDQFKETPLLLIQGIFEDLDKSRIEDLEYTEIVQKPFDSEMLVSKLQTLIGQAIDPDTLPEEPENGQLSRENKEDEYLGSRVMPDPDEKLAGKIKQEILGLERELEKRITSRVKAEVFRALHQDALDKKTERR